MRAAARAGRESAQADRSPPRAIATPGPAPDLVQRDFTVDGPDRLWVADITYVPTGAGFLYLAVVLDAWSRRVVGWAMATHLRTELVLAALDMAIVQRLPRDVIHHSDQGCQYTSIAYGQALPGVRRPARRWARSATRTTTRCARASSPPWSASCSGRTRFRTPAEARLAIFEFIEGWYNPHRRHSALGYESPRRYERLHAAEAGRTPALTTSVAALSFPAPLGQAGAISLATGSSNDAALAGRLPAAPPRWAP